MLDHSEATYDESKAVSIKARYKNLAKLGEEILVRFSSVIKTAQIFEQNNNTFIRQIGLFFNRIQNALANEKEALFQFKKNILFFNYYRVKFDFSTYDSFKFLADAFREREIGLLNFSLGLQEEELKDFILLFNDTETKKENPFEDFRRKLAASGISHITIEKMHPSEILIEESIEEQKKFAKKVFFKSITHLQEIIQRERQRKRIKVKTTQRLMQTIIDLIIQNESIMVGLTNLKNHNEYTLNHSVNVCLLSLCLGRRLGLDKRELRDLGISAFFHDIGKLEVPEEILNKPGKLNDKEREEVEKHPYQGAVKLTSLEDMNLIPVKALCVAMEHHIDADLSGYPKYWKKNYMDIFSKIVEISDFFDAITTERPYRKKVMSREEALKLMLKDFSYKFDPLILKVFANMLGIYPIGSLVALNSGEVGIVTELNPNKEFMARPRVKLISDETGNKIDGEIVDLAEKDSATNTFKRTILKSLDPKQYNIKISDYFLVEGSYL
ncbi:MAG: HD-GYP domain-containing protein [Candidatus Aminicenantaceae bacterium]